MVQNKKRKQSKSKSKSKSKSNVISTPISNGGSSNQDQIIKVLVMCFVIAIIGYGMYIAKQDQYEKEQRIQEQLKDEQERLRKEQEQREKEKEEERKEEEIRKKEEKRLYDYDVKLRIVNSMTYTAMGFLMLVQIFANWVIYMQMTQKSTNEYFRISMIMLIFAIAHGTYTYEKIIQNEEHRLYNPDYYKAYGLIFMDVLFFFFGLRVFTPIGDFYKRNGMFATKTRP